MKPVVRIIVAGGRDFYDYSLLHNSLEKIISEDYSDHEIVIVSGNAPGADREGERFADNKGYEKALYPAQWTEFGKAAGHIRNQQMAENADVVVAFWNDRSPGTADMIERATNNKLKKYIIRY